MQQKSEHLSIKLDHGSLQLVHDRFVLRAEDGRLLKRWTADETLATVALFELVIARRTPGRTSHSGKVGVKMLWLNEKSFMQIFLTHGPEGSRGRMETREVVTIIDRLSRVYGKEQLRDLLSQKHDQAGAT